MREENDNRGLVGFLTIWAGQLVSVVGSGLTSFALGVWVLEKTGSSFSFSVLAACALLPSILLLPMAGALVDRWDRRRIMMMADIGAAVCTIGSALLLLAGYLDLLPLAVLTALASVAKAFRWPAYAASVTLLVPRQHLGRANGLVQLGEAAAEIIAPLSAGWLVLRIGLEGVILVDAASFIVGVGTLLVVRIPRPAKVVAAKVSIVAEVVYAWRYFRNRSGLFELLCFAFFTNFALLASCSSASPARAFVRQCRRARERDRRRRIGRRSRQRSDERLGRISAPDSDDPCVDSRAGLLCCRGGSPSKRHTHRHMPVRHPILLSDYRGVDERDMANQGFARSSGPCVRYPTDVQLVEYSYRLFVLWILAEHIFNPMLVEGGALADTLGRIVGVGPGRGIAVMFQPRPSSPLSSF